MTVTLAHDFYHDDGIFERECESFFRRHWWLIGPAASVAAGGDYAALCLLRWPLVAVRDRQGERYACYNLCRHRACPGGRLSAQQEPGRLYFQQQVGGALGDSR